MGAGTIALDQVVWVDSGRLGGIPCFAGTRVPVPDDTLTSYLPLFDQMLRTIDAARAGDISVIP